MRRSQKAAVRGADSDLKAPLLESRGSSGNQQQNAGHGAAFGGEVVEMTDFQASRGGYRRRRGDLDRVADEDLTYVWHELEPHHTLAGIALQYRVTVEQLKSANQLVTDQEIAARKRLMIPTHRHGVLFNNPEEYKSSDHGAVTHTTANPKPPDKSRDGTLVFDPRLSYRKSSQSDGDFEQGRREGFIVVNVTDVDDLEAAAGAKDPHRNASAEYLASFDSQMQSAIRAMDSTLQKQSSNENEVVPLVRTAPRPPQDWEIQFTDWKTAVVALSVVLLVSFSTVFLYKFVSAPQPHA
eukprot:m.97301 g.97301  ORF g.97301 m.97301 type:complete len:296 (-) comp10208_c0_seq1:388-1275(-)